MSELEVENFLLGLKKDDYPVIQYSGNDIFCNPTDDRSWWIQYDYNPYSPNSFIMCDEEFRSEIAKGKFQRTNN